MITHHFAGGLYAKETHIPAGHCFVQHRHLHDHLAILAVGTVQLLVEDDEMPPRVISAPACITLPARQHHGVLALNDVVWYCLWASDRTTPEDADANLVLPAADMAATLKE